MHHLAFAQSGRNQSCSAWSESLVIHRYHTTYHNQGCKVRDRTHCSLDHAPSQVRACGSTGLVYNRAHAASFLDRPDEECNSSNGDEVRLHREQNLDLMDREPNGNQAECPEEEEAYERLGVSPSICGHAVWHVVLDMDQQSSDTRTGYERIWTKWSATLALHILRRSKLAPRTCFR